MRNETVVLAVLLACLSALAAVRDGDAGNNLLEYAEVNGHKLAVRRWTPDVAHHKPRAVILVQHGAQPKHSMQDSPSAYFSSFGTELAAAGFECVAFDRQGTGYSEGEEPRGYVNGIDSLAEDLERVLERELLRHRNGTHFFVLGEGIGSVVVLHHAMRNRQMKGVYPSAAAVSGYLLCAPLLRPNQATMPLRMGLLMPFLKISSVMRPRMQLSSANQTSFLSHSSNVLPVGVAPAFARPAFELLDAGSRIIRSASALQFPLAIFCGVHNDIVDVPDCRRIFETSTSVDKVLKVYEGGTSVLFGDGEDVVTQFVTDVIHWLDQRSDRRTAATPTLDALLKRGGEEGGSGRRETRDVKCTETFANSESDGSGSCKCKRGYMMGAAGQCVQEDESRGGGFQNLHRNSRADRDGVDVTEKAGKNRDDAF